jgi:hypothetical protein
VHEAVLSLEQQERGRPGGLLGARGVAADSCLYGETYALRTVRARYPNSARAQQAVQYYLGGGPALTGPQARARARSPRSTLWSAEQHLCENGRELSWFAAAVDMWPTVAGGVRV